MGLAPNERTHGLNYTSPADGGRDGVKSSPWGYSRRELETAATNARETAKGSAKGAQGLDEEKVRAI